MYIHAYIHAQQACTRTQARAHTHTRWPHNQQNVSTASPLANTRKHTHARTYTHTHARTRTHTQSHAHTHKTMTTIPIDII